MDDVDTQLLGAVRRWGGEGRRFVLVTVARTWGSAPRPPGAWMAIDDSGTVQGSVSGGCIEDDLVRRVMAGEFRGGVPQVVRYGVTREQSQRFGLPCGGTLELVVEPLPDLALLSELAARIAGGELVRREIDTQSGAVRLAAADRGEKVQWDGRLLVTAHGPAWRLLIIGAGQIARFLAPMAQALGYCVGVCDPRAEYTTEWDIPGAPLVKGMPDDAVRDLTLDRHSAVVALTHDPKLDDMAVIEALCSPAFYVGALGSRVNNDRRRRRLREHFDLTDAQIGRLHGPIGLPIGSRVPPEIAVSILAEMTAEKNMIISCGNEAPHGTPWPTREILRGTVDR